jgi:hypothetical protein
MLILFHLFLACLLALILVGLYSFVGQEFWEYLSDNNKKQPETFFQKTVYFVLQWPVMLVGWFKNKLWN